MVMCPSNERFYSCVFKEYTKIGGKVFDIL